MSKAVENVSMLIGDMPCITTTEFKRRLGISVTGDDLRAIGLKPFSDGPIAVYWRERDVFIAAMELANRLMRVAVRNSRKG